MEKRRMPVEKDWFEKKSNDLLYGFMQASAIYDLEEQDKEKKLAYSKIQFTKDRAVLQKLIGKKDLRTLKSKVNTLIEKGYLAEDENNYYFPYNKDNFYLLIDRDLLYFICTTMSEFSLKTYVYLADKARMKDNYHFTIKELLAAFGYGDCRNTTMEKIITGCLALLSETNIIQYHVEYVDVPKGNGAYKAPNMVLDFVATTVPKNIRGKIQETKETTGKEFTF